MKKPEFLKKRNVRYGTAATAITVGFIAVIVVINIVATLLLDQFPLTLDLTSSGKYEISDETVEFIGKVDRPVTIYILADEAVFDDPSSTYTYQNGQILKKYDQYSDQISISYIDLEANPGFASKYPDYTFASGDILIESDLRSQKFAFQDQYNYSYDTNGNVTGISTALEELLTGALVYVTDDNPTQVVFTGGHGENGVSGLVSVLQKNSFEVTALATLGGSIDPETDIVIVAAPSVDFTDEEIAKLDEYLNNGGDYDKQLLYIADPSQPELPHLEAFLAEWGIEFMDGAVVETDPNRLYNTAFWSIQNDATLDLKFAGRDEALKAPIVMRNVRPITALFEAQNLRSTRVLSTTYDSSVLYPLDAPDDWQPDDQPKQVFNTIVAGQKETDAALDKEATRSTVVAFGSMDMFATGVGDSSSFGNSQYVVSLLNELCGKEEALTIVSKDLTAVSLDINAAVAIILGIVFVIGLPLVVLVLGIMVFVRRRHL